MKPFVWASVIGAVIVLGGLYAIVFGVPNGSEIRSEIVVGTRPDGQQLFREEREERRVYPLSPEGLFYQARFRYLHYVERGPTTHTELAFLRDPGPVIRTEYELLQPILPLQPEDRWAAFQLSKVSRDQVDMVLYVFDRAGLRKTLTIADAVRTDRSAEGWERIESYSISQPEAEGPVMIRTAGGVVTYDPATDEITSPAP